MLHQQDRKRYSLRDYLDMEEQATSPKKMLTVTGASETIMAWMQAWNSTS